MKKKCNTCKEDLSTKFFSKNSSKKDGLHGSCKGCKSKHQKNWYKNASEQHKVNVNRNRLSRKIEVYKKLIAYYKKHPCVVCGETDPLVLEFDHLRDKKCNISKLIIHGYGWEALLEEIAKCQVLCVNCHRRKTAKQFNWHILKVIEDESERDNCLTLNQE